MALLTLPEELTLEITYRCASVRDGARLTQACSALHAQQAAHWISSMSRILRLEWDPAFTKQHTISNERTLLRYYSHGGTPWAAGKAVLPTSGKSSWQMRIDQSHDNDGRMTLGVCDEAARCGWGLQCAIGMLQRVSRDEAGESDPFAPPPPFFPDVEGMSTLKLFPGKELIHTTGQPATLQGIANGSVVEVIVDHDLGVLSYRLNDNPVVEALRGFPPGARLRPWAHLNWEEDQVTLVGPLRVEEQVQP